jgi:tetratricopeptide (TPR) repeat protein
VSLLDLQAGRGRDARTRVAKALETRPNDPQLWLLQARLAASMGDDAAAEPALRRALATDPDALEAYEILARLYVRRRELDRAARELEAAAGREPKAVAPRIMLGVIRQVQGRGAEAEAQYAQALALEPRAAVAANNLAGLVAARGDLDRALDLAKAAKAQLPERAEVSDTLADVYMRKAMPQLAVPLWRQAVDRDPKPAYRYRLAGAYRATGRAAEARQELERALATKGPFEERAAAERELAELRKSP